MIRKFSALLVIVPLLFTGKLSGQYALQVSDDTTVCAGAPVQLSVSGGTTYIWSPSTYLSNASIADPVATPLQTTTYVVSSSVQDTNMAVNGNFSAGNTGFTSSYIYTLPPDNDGQQRYWVGSTPNAFSSGMENCPVPTGGTGNMLVANGAEILNTNVWCETLSVVPNSTYNLSGYITALNNFTIPQLPEAQWTVNGVNVGSAGVTIPYIGACYWVNFTATWNSGINTSATFCIYDPDTVADGNDYAIDDLIISGPVPLTDTVVITVLSPPTINLGNDTSFCSGQSVNLNATASNSTYLWSTGSTASDITVSSSGLYWVEVNNGCIASDSIQVSVISQPSAINLGNDTTYCGSFSSVLSTGNSQTIWSTGTTGPQITVSAPGTYWAVDSNQCGEVSDTISISQNQAPVVSLGNDTAICSTQSVSLNAGNAGSDYEWSNAATTQTINVASPGTYSVTVTNSSGCSSSDTIIVGAYAVPLSITTVNTSCGLSNGSATAVITDGNGPFDYTWSNDSTVASISNLEPDTYMLTVTDINGCSAVDSAVINPSSANSIQLTADKTSICPNDSAKICAPAGYIAYLWNNGDTTACFYTNLAAGYSVTATDDGNCTASSNQLTITVLPTPQISISVSGDTIKCLDGVSFQWFYNEDSIQGANTDQYVALNPGSYSVEITDTNGCNATSNPLNITGINSSFNDNSIKVFPNPLEAGFYNIQVDNSVLGAIAEIFDENGKLLYQAKIISVNSIIDLNVARGIYLLRIISGDKFFTQKLVSLKD